MKMKLGSRLLAGFAGISLICAAVGGVGIKGLSDSSASLKELRNNDVGLLRLSASISKAALNCRRYEKDFFLNIGNKEKQAEYERKFDSAFELLQNSIKDSLNKAAADPQIDSETLKRIKGMSEKTAAYAVAFKTLAKEISLAEKAPSPQDANKKFAAFKEEIRQMEDDVDFLSSKVS